jgi:pSer/pThr/pTyr-binding forkhead associated (FHA) protein
MRQRPVVCHEVSANAAGHGTGVAESMYRRRHTLPDPETIRFSGTNRANSTIPSL